MSDTLTMIDAEAVARKCGWRNRVTVWRTTKRDPNFPRPRQVSANRTAWVEREIDAWLSSRPVAAAYINSAA